MKKINLFTIGLLLIIILSSCRNGIKKGIDISYDDVAGFASHPTLVNENAHSGKMCLRLDSLNQYGMLYRIKISDLSQNPIRQISIHGWARMANIESKATLVCALDSSNKNVFWSGSSITDFVDSPNDWTEVNFEIELPDFTGPDYSLVIYPLCNSNEPIWFDDLSILFSE
jgi:hypothetical protein